jgi:hypothetical protein
VTQQLDEAHHLANAYRDYPALKLIALNTGDLTVEQYFLSLITAQDSALYELREQLRTKPPTTREEILEEVAASLEEQWEWGGAYGQRKRKPTGFAKAAAHVRSLK